MPLLTRRTFLKSAAGGMLGAGALAGYASGYESGYALDLTTYSLNPPRWPRDLELKISIIADIHACYPFVSEQRIRDIVALSNAQMPDLVVLLGDFVCTHSFVSGYVPPSVWAGELARLESKFGSYAILGNHDWWYAAIPTDPPDGSRSIRAALAGARIPLLENDAVRLQQGRKPFWLVGLGDQMAFSGKRPWPHRGADDLPAALRALNDDAPAILLAHEPYVFDHVPDRVALTLSGHMHGGQVNLPLIGAPVRLMHPHLGRRVYGVYQEGERTMLISGGIGTSFVPIRVNRPPEVVILNLGGAASA